MSEREGYELTKKQKVWVLERDGYQPGEAEVHHIMAIAYAVALLGMTREQINDPTNLISKTPEEHKALHYPPHLIGDWRETGDPYWNTIYDDDMREIAEIRTFLKEQSGDKFPERR